MLVIITGRPFSWKSVGTGMYSYVKYSYCPFSIMISLFIFFFWPSLRFTPRLGLDVEGTRLMSETIQNCIAMCLTGRYTLCLNILRAITLKLSKNWRLRETPAKLKITNIFSLAKNSVDVNLEVDANQWVDSCICAVLDQKRCHLWNSWL